MPIEARCGKCGKGFTLRDEYAGKKIRCPACGGIIAASAAPSGGADPGAAPRAVGRPAAPPAAPASPPPRRPSASFPSAAKIAESPPRPAIPPRASEAAAASRKTTVIMRSPDGSPPLPSTCPKCKKNLPPGQVICAACGFNVKLGRNLGLAAAIAEASAERRVLVGGTRLLTRAEMVEERHTFGRRLWRSILAAAAGIIAAIAIGFWVLLHRVEWGEDLPNLRKKVDRWYKEGDARTAPAQFHPFFVGVPVRIALPRERLTVEAPAMPAGAISATAFAEAACLPYFHTSEVFYERRVVRVLAALAAENGRFSPRAFARGLRLPNGKIVVWRQAPRPEQNGFLQGALLDCDAEEEEARLAALPPAAQIVIHGTLSFIASQRRQFSASAYRLALEERLLRLPPGLNPAAAALAAPAAEEETVYCFHPVIVVKEMEVERSPRR